MKRYLLDTGIASDFIHRRRGVPERVRDINARGGRVGVCTPVVGELHSGVELSETRERNRGRLIRALSDLFSARATMTHLVLEPRPSGSGIG